MIHFQVYLEKIKKTLAKAIHIYPIKTYSKTVRLTSILWIM
ncbi:hypothetical protein QW060_08900 [Myroides ceti]|uniref:Uncharacterized protein n=1 Tax=Paenimyroides ceti TaxID=395087 RepID=A0ABT8CRW1_9FLAO|nr:hypothetical protein [Paenimyroides ceti]MDN3707252.1 hypothetical protein [Paenimyroides ceti]